MCYRQTYNNVYTLQFLNQQIVLLYFVVITSILNYGVINLCVYIYQLLSRDYLHADIKLLLFYSFVIIPLFTILFNFI